MSTESAPVFIDVSMTLKVFDREDWESVRHSLGSLGPYVIDIDGVPDEWREPLP